MKRPASMGETLPKRIINGDYYQLASSGRYHRHEDVTVHCHHPEPAPETHHSDILLPSHHNPEIPERKRQEMMGLKSKFLQNCKQILEKEEVNSIHEEDPGESQEVSSKKGKTMGEHRFKNIKMSTSQIEASPKRGILKRSMIDKKQQEDREDQQSKRQNKKYKVERSVTIEDNPQIKQMKEVQRSHLSQTARLAGERYDRNDHQFLRRQKTQGKQTVAITSGRPREASSDEITEDKYGNFQACVAEDIQFLKERLEFLEKELQESEKRMKRYDLQREQKKQKEEIQRITKQNQQLRKMAEEKHVHNQQSKHIDFSSFEPILKYVEQKPVVVISFLLMLAICLMLGKSGNSCSK